MSPTPAVRDERAIPGQWVPLSERRLHVRFPLELSAGYWVDGQQGVATTSDFSSAAVFVRLDRLLRLGERVKLSINWPVRLNEDAALRLLINGIVVRSDARGAAISIARHEFRVRPI